MKKNFIISITNGHSEVSFIMSNVYDEVHARGLLSTHVSSYLDTKEISNEDIDDYKDFMPIIKPIEIKS